MKTFGKINVSRLAQLLQPHGFIHHGTDCYCNRIVFMRDSYQQDILELVIIEAQGKNNEAIYASVGISLTHSVMFELLGEVMLLEEIAADRQKGWTLIRDDNKAQCWEHLVASTAPVRAAELVHAKGAFWLDKTKDLRLVVDKYCSYIDYTDSLLDTISKLQACCTQDQLAEVNRLSSCPIFSEEQRIGKCYLIACILVTLYSSSVENDSYYNQIPLVNTHLIALIELLADRINYSFAESC